MDESPSLSRSFKSVVYSAVGLQQHHKPLRQAFYNTAALAFLAVSGVVAVSAYYVLEAFLRPLIWAALAGTFLFPFKKTLTGSLRVWLTRLEDTGTPLAVGSVLLPFVLLNKGFHILENIAKSNWKLLLTVLVLVPLCYGLIIFHPFYQMFCAAEIMVMTLIKMIACFNNPLAVWSLFFGYLVVLVFSKNLNDESGVVALLNKAFSTLTWFIVVFYIISLTGSWKLPIVIILACLMAIGYTEQKKTEKEERIKSPVKSQLSVKFVVDNTLTVLGIKRVESTSVISDESNFSSSSIETGTEEVTSDMLFSSSAGLTPVDEAAGEVGSSTPLSTTTTAPPKTERATHSHGKKNKVNKKRTRSAPYFLALFWLFALSFFWVHFWILSFLLFLLPLKYIWRSIRKSHVFISTLQRISLVVKNFYLERKETVSPWVVRKALSCLHSGDKKLVCYLNNSLDKLMSMMIVLCLILIASMATAFFAFQVQQESSYLVTVATNVVNKTITSNKEYLQWLNLNDSDVRKTFDSTIHSGYLVARGKMAKYISSVITSKNSSYMENQVTQLMDQLYDAWAGQKDNLKKEVPSAADEKNTSVAAPPKNVLSAAWSKLKNLATSSDYMKVLEIFKENVHTMYSVLDSLWLILKGNVNLMFSVITTIISMLFFSGTYILNALISLIIFVTTLFYLLNSSSEEYKVMELLSGLSVGTGFGESITNAIQDVFGASLKMATFYFLFTWLTHDTFGANLVFIPAALAAMLGVVPFIGTYWAAVPAALELWLIQNKGMLSIFLIVLHFIPTYVVDTAIYSEIGEGGHPYLTGLAVAGGVYCFGLEGAFIGPFVLCCLIAAFDIYNTVMNSNDMRDRSMTSPVKGDLRRGLSIS